MGSLIEKEARHLFTAESGARTPSREDLRAPSGQAERDLPALASTADRRDPASTSHRWLRLRTRCTELGAQ
ncbi:hypothetical protein MLP_24210 [Microlunatus phosphovorus NM-1]|uniref:Uncharacterized protein n=1 Tax=Microlunatus phosphovorus (strain ATCC 700054 / DSM 10555 / JCM 9379 / NBRC 101784 / NCIMB 13414 / VKM Ac-1990 / NM-1) TaxID=1032480 RepID=F5XFM8_MICPN|nr:hypothetical protein MLP_24210 [Microlunatus phosphovorus NM-1]